MSTPRLSVHGPAPHRVAAALALCALAVPAWAHHGMDGATPRTLEQGLVSGLAHPVIGLDHLAFLVVAILLVLALKGAARWVVPLVFVAGTVAGTALHLGATNIPMSETLVAASIVVAGGLLIAGRVPGAPALATLFAVCGVLHGYAYGESIIGAEATPLAAYLAGFAMIQYAIIAGGAAALEAVAGRSPRLAATLHKLGNGLALLAGALFLATSLA
ncbi:MAG: HupE/UreJ family protein [Burkholderiales bacterium]